MEELKLEYYFKNIEEFAFKEVFNNCIYPWEALNNINDYIKKFMNNEDMKINKASEIGEFCSIQGNYFIDEGTKIGANVTIQGPVIIGKDAEIRHCAFIRGNAIVGENAVVGNSTELKNVILFNL